MSSSRERWRRRIDRWRGRATDQDVEPYRKRAEEIEGRSADLDDVSDESLKNDARGLRHAAAAGAALDDLEIEAFAVVHQAATRTLRLTPYRVQLLAGLAMRGGRLVEMQTGEGKTLAAVFPAFLHSLTGRGAHVLTFNDYLARRDATWMGPLYRFLGSSTGAVQEGMSRRRRLEAYAADVTYVTAKEAGFDLLRDSLCIEPAEVVQRPLFFALVDEADSLLIDEARVPLVIAEGVHPAAATAYRMAEVVRRLELDVHYATDEYRRNVDLTDDGLQRVEDLLGCGDLLEPENLTTYAEVNCALQAAALFRRDVDYILRDGRIRLVDELTGRVVEDRQWPDGLQAALEAKEGLELRPEGRILGSITLQHFLQLYPRLCGMTGTAHPAEEELREIYGLEVMVVPPNRPCVRNDLPDLVFTDQEAKLRALVREIRDVQVSGRPVLVGTLSVAESDRLAAALREAGVTCEVLNARTDEREAKIVAHAGVPGAVTISTNMAGRGTDIRLGGADEQQHEQVVALGGLYVIGTNRHESLRIDRQLRGRAGRQGDPGSSRLFISLEDELIVRYGIQRLIPPRSRPDRSDEPIENPVVRREIARAQRIVEGQNFEIRRTLWRYAEPVEKQRRILHEWREKVLHGRDPLDRFERGEPVAFAGASERVGKEAMRLAERQATLYQIDRQWSEHLAEIAELRSGIHLLRIGGRDPLEEFVRRTVESFRHMQRSIEERTLFTLRDAAIGEAGLDLEREGLDRPSATWTYLVSDDPFRDQLGIQLAGDTGFAAAAALYTGPLLLLWGLYNRYFRRRAPRA